MSARKRKEIAKKAARSIGTLTTRLAVVTVPIWMRLASRSVLYLPK